MASPNMLMMPSDPRPVRGTEMILAFEKFEGSSMLLPVTSLKVRRTLSSFLC